MLRRSAPNVLLLTLTSRTGPFRIYRAPGSVAFLSCGSALQPILPKSQCWCVDEASSKYVLQVRRPQYWRIEVPVADDGDIRLALLLREVLEKVLRFEKTECPFNRSFSVELPEPPQTPVRMRPWTPVGKSFVSLPPTPVTPIYIAPLSKAQAADDVRVSTDENVTECQDKVVDDTTSPSKLDLEISIEETPETGRALETPDRAPQEDDVVGLSNTERDTSDSGNTLSTTHEEAADSIPNPNKRNGFQASRALTAPPRLTLLTTPPSKVMQTEEPEPQVEIPESNSPTESQDSFHSIESWASPITPLPLSPPLSLGGSPTVFPCGQDDLQVEKATICQEDTPDLTVSLKTPRQTWGAQTIAATDGSQDEASSAPPSVQDEEFATCSAETPDETAQSPSSVPETDHLSTSTSAALTRRPFTRHRPTTSSSISPSRRALSPLPPAANLFSPRQPFRSKTTTSRSASSRLALVRRLPMAVVHKTVEILLSPPAHLINLMLRVAARIAAGEWRGYVFGTGEGGETIPVRWDWSDEDDDGHGELGGWAADEDLGLGLDVPCAAAGRGERRVRRRATGEHLKMAGSFPESPSDDDDDDEDGAEGYVAGQESRNRGVTGTGTGNDDVQRQQGEGPNNNDTDWGRSSEVD